MNNILFWNWSDSKFWLCGLAYCCTKENSLVRSWSFLLKDLSKLKDMSLLIWIKLIKNITQVTIWFILSTPLESVVWKSKWLELQGSKLIPPLREYINQVATWVMFHLINPVEPWWNIQDWFCNFSSQRNMAICIAEQIQNQREEKSWKENTCCNKFCCNYFWLCQNQTRQSRICIHCLLQFQFLLVLAYLWLLCCHEDQWYY